MTVEGTDLPAAPPVPRARHREPGRVRGHLPAARGAARQVPAAAGRGLSRSRPARPRCSAGVSSAAARRPWSNPWSTRTLLALQAGRGTGGRGRRRRRLLRRPRQRPPGAHRAVEVGASPRGSLALLLVARALAVLDGRDAVLPEDVKAVAVPALAHRLTLRPETWATGTDRRRRRPGGAGRGPRPGDRAGSVADQDEQSDAAVAARWHGGDLGPHVSERRPTPALLSGVTVGAVALGLGLATGRGGRRRSGRSPADGRRARAPRVAAPRRHGSRRHWDIRRYRTRRYGSRRRRRAARDCRPGRPGAARAAPRRARRRARRRPPAGGPAGPPRRDRPAAGR